MTAVHICGHADHEEGRVDRHGNQGEQAGPGSAQQRSRHGKRDQQVGNQWVGCATSENQQKDNQGYIQEKVENQLILGSGNARGENA